MKKQDQHNIEELELLVVDDDELTRSLLERVVRRLPVRSFVTGDPVEALAVIERNVETLGLVISDVVMPGMDGVQLTQRVRAMTEELPILLISGYTNEEFEGVLEQPNLYFLQKPFLPKQLLEFVERFTSVPRVANRRSASS